MPGRDSNRALHAGLEPLRRGQRQKKTPFKTRKKHVHLVYRPFFYPLRSKLESRILLMEHNYPPPLFLIFVYLLFLCLLQVRLGKGQVCPAGLGKRFSQGPAWLKPPAGARKNEKSKCAPSAKEGIKPIFHSWFL